jgi:hypothetical protein
VDYYSCAIESLVQDFDIGERPQPFSQVGHQPEVEHLLPLNIVELGRILLETEGQLALENDAQRYEALFRITEAISACREPEKLSHILAEQLREIFDFRRSWRACLQREFRGD